MGGKFEYSSQKEASAIRPAARKTGRLPSAKQLDGGGAVVEQLSSAPAPDSRASGSPQHRTTSGSSPLNRTGIASNRRGNVQPEFRIPQTAASADSFVALDVGEEVERVWLDTAGRTSGRSVPSTPPPTARAPAAVLTSQGVVTGEEEERDGNVLMAGATWNRAGDTVQAAPATWRPTAAGSSYHDGAPATRQVPALVAPGDSARTRDAVQDGPATWRPTAAESSNAEGPTPTRQVPALVAPGDSVGTRDAVQAAPATWRPTAAGSSCPTPAASAVTTSTAAPSQGSTAMGGKFEYSSQKAASAIRPAVHKTGRLPSAKQLDGGGAVVEQLSSAPAPDSRASGSPQHRTTSGSSPLNRTGVASNRRGNVQPEFRIPQTAASADSFVALDVGEEVERVWLDTAGRTSGRSVPSTPPPTALGSSSPTPKAAATRAPAAVLTSQGVVTGEEEERDGNVLMAGATWNRAGDAVQAAPATWRPTAAGSSYHDGAPATRQVPALVAPGDSARTRDAVQDGPATWRPTAAGSSNPEGPTPTRQVPALVAPGDSVGTRDAVQAAPATWRPTAAGSSCPTPAASAVTTSTAAPSQGSTAMGGKFEYSSQKAASAIRPAVRKTGRLPSAKQLDGGGAVVEQLSSAPAPDSRASGSPQHRTTSGSSPLNRTGVASNRRGNVQPEFRIPQTAASADSFVALDVGEEVERVWLDTAGRTSGRSVPSTPPPTALGSSSPTPKAAATRAPAAVLTSQGVVTGEEEERDGNVLMAGATWNRAGDAVQAAPATWRPTAAGSSYHDGAPATRQVPALVAPGDSARTRDAVQDGPATWRPTAAGSSNPEGPTPTRQVPALVAPGDSVGTRDAVQAAPATWRPAAAGSRNPEGPTPTRQVPALVAPGDSVGTRDAVQAAPATWRPAAAGSRNPEGPTPTRQFPAPVAPGDSVGTRDMVQAAPATWRLTAAGSSCPTPAASAVTTSTAAPSQGSTAMGGKFEYSSQKEAGAIRPAARKTGRLPSDKQLDGGGAVDCLQDLASAVEVIDRDALSDGRVPNQQSNALTRLETIQPKLGMTTSPVFGMANDECNLAPAQIHPSKALQ